MKSLVLLSLAFVTLLQIEDNPAATDERVSGPLSSSDIAAVQQFGDTIGVAEWLGPLAPVALSPFFGITCLSGMSRYGQGWVSADNAFLGEHSPLRNPAVFWVFLGLTILTSVPRFTKVSKPFAQAVDHAEAWSGIITMVVLRFMMTSGDLPAEQPQVVSMGVLSFTTDTVMMIAAALNIFVINAVKFFFEMLVWITPVPAIDALFEVANKTTCAALMAIYGYSATLATVINLSLFAISALLFRWMYRREVFFRVMLFDALLALVSPRSTFSDTNLCVFPEQEIGDIPVRARCRLQKTNQGWTLTQARLLRPSQVIELSAGDTQLELQPGW